MSFLLTQNLGDAWPMILTALIGGYLSGSVPYGLLLTRIFGMGDIRKIGSGNIGATNVLRTGSKKLAIATLLLDALKGTIPVLVAKQFHMDYAVIAGLGAFFGHLFPVWLRFKGGKGVATAIGILLGLNWQIGVCVICVWLLTAMITKYSSASALLAFAVSPLLAGILTHGDYQMILTTLIVAVVVWARHHENIRRLANGSEGKINLGGKKNA